MLKQVVLGANGVADVKNPNPPYKKNGYLGSLVFRTYRETVYLFYSPTFTKHVDVLFISILNEKSEFRCRFMEKRSEIKTTGSVSSHSQLRIDTPTFSYVLDDEMNILLNGNDRGQVSARGFRHRFGRPP
jgi:hypothetical protein